MHIAEPPKAGQAGPRTGQFIDSAARQRVSHAVGRPGGFLSKRLAPWIAAVWAVLQVAPAGAQGNIDAGKTPAQIFGDTCSACHRSARDLRRTSTSFLRTHYATSADEAAAMANYLANIGSDPRAAQPQPRRPPGDVGKQTPDLARQNPRPPAEQAKSAQGQPKGRPSPTAQARPAPAPEEKPPDPPAAPVLEPFEE